MDTQDERHDEHPRERGQRYVLTPRVEALALAEFVAEQIRRDRSKREHPRGVSAERRRSHV